jgi:hypothetical protein
MIVAIVGVFLGLLAVAGMLGALFGIIWWGPLKRYGTWMLLSAWLFSTLLVAGAGALRATVAARHVGSASSTSRLPMNLLLFYATALGLTLVPTAAALQWRARRRPNSSFATILLSSAACAMVGLVFMLVVVFRFELTRVFSNR